MEAADLAHRNGTDVGGDSVSCLVRIRGWSPGLEKVSTTSVVRRLAQLGLRDAKSVTDRVLDGVAVDVEVGGPRVAQELVHELRALGALADVVEDPS